MAGNVDDETSLNVIWSFTRLSNLKSHLVQKVLTLDGFFFGKKQFFVKALVIFFC